MTMKTPKEIKVTIKKNKVQPKKKIKVTTKTTIQAKIRFQAATKIVNHVH